MSKHVRDSVVYAMQLKIAAAKALRGYTWQQISTALQECGITLSTSNLMSKQSRCSYKTKELIVLLRILDVEALDISNIEVDGLDKAKSGLNGG